MVSLLHCMRHIFENVQYDLLLPFIFVIINSPLLSSFQFSLNFETIIIRVGELLIKILFNTLLTNSAFNNPIVLPCCHVTTFDWIIEVKTRAKGIYQCAHNGSPPSNISSLCVVVPFLGLTGFLSWPYIISKVRDGCFLSRPVHPHVGSRNDIEQK